MKFYQKLFVFLVVLISLRFFDAQFLNKSAVSYIQFITLLIIFAISIQFILVRNEGFVLQIQLIVLSIIISIFMAAFSWNQSLKDSIMETAPYLLWIFFFYLLQLQVPVKTIEKIILIYGVLYVILYFYQLAQSPVVIFGRSLEGDEFIERRGIERIIFPGAGIFILAVFIAINKLTTGAKGKFIWLSFTLLGIIIPVLQVTRQFIAGILLIYLFHFLKGQSIFKRILVFGLFIGAFLYVNNMNNSLVHGLKESASEDFGQRETYIRVLAGNYFLNDFSPSGINRILGNGAPNWGVSYYGIYVQNLETVRGYYISDVGIIGMYAMFGILAIIGYILIWFKSFTLPLPKEYYYLKYYLWYLLFTSLTWFSVYHYHYLISTVFVIYMYHKVYLRKKRLNGFMTKDFLKDSRV
jgi:hypothetical protein